jgi:hypothetical protein
MLVMRWRFFGTRRCREQVVGPYEPDSTLQGMPNAVRRLIALVATPRLGESSATLLADLGDLFARRVELRTGAALAKASRDADLQRRAARCGRGFAPAPEPVARW